MKNLAGLYTVLIFMSAMAGCNKAFKVNSITLHPSSVETVPLDTIQISFAMDYSGGDFKDNNLIQPLWESSDAEVVKVDSMGKIYTLAPGNADIIMSCGGASAICKVTVLERSTDSDAR